MSSYIARDFAEVIRLNKPGDGEIILDYPRGPNIITRALRNRRGRQKTGLERDSSLDFGFQDLRQRGISVRIHLLLLDMESRHSEEAIDPEDVTSQ